MSQQREMGTGPDALQSEGILQDTRCLTCWLILAGSPEDGYQLPCGHWLCSPCLDQLQASVEEAFGPNICFRCHAPVFIPAKAASSPPAVRKSRPRLSWTPTRTGSHEETAPIMRSPERGPPQIKKSGTFWKRKLAQGKDIPGAAIAGLMAKHLAYSKLDERGSPPNSPIRPGGKEQGANCHKTRQRFSLRVF